MRYSDWSKTAMIGELVLRGKVLTQEEAKAATKDELRQMLLSCDPCGTDWDEPDSETGRFG